MSRSIDAFLIVLAIVCRIAAVWILQSHLVPRSAYEHGEIAANLVAGRGFAIKFLGADGPTSQQAPIYPALVAGAYAIGGVDTPRALLILEVTQCVLGGLLVLGVLRLCRLIAPDPVWVAWLAGLVVALHPTLVYSATHVQVATLGATALVWTLAWSYRTGLTNSVRDAAMTGGLLAFLALVDPILSLVMVGVAWSIWQAGQHPQDPRRAFRLIVVAGIVAVIGVSPWLIRNAMVHGEFVAIKSTFGYAFWQGNCSLSEGTDKVVRRSVDNILESGDEGPGLAGLNRILWKARHEAGYLDDIALSKADYRLLGAVSEPERSRILFKRAISDLLAVPDRYARLCVRRLRYFVLFDETNPKSRVLAYRVPHVGLTVFAGIGLLLMPRALRWKLVPTIVTVALIALFHTLTIVSARFHIPIEPLLAIWGAVGCTRWQPAHRGRLTPAGYHVKGIGVENRLQVAAVISRRDLFPGRVVH